MSEGNVNTRIEYLDFLRVMATSAVIMIHVVAEGWLGSDIDTSKWQIYNLFYSILRWAVPVFVMISGTLFLGGEEKTLGIIYGKNIAKIITAFCFWSALYAGVYGKIQGCAFEDKISMFFIGSTHMWFLFMITGLYMLIPILRKVTESIELTKYMLLLLLLFSVLLPFSISIISVKFTGMGSVLSRMFEGFNYLSSLGYVYYFMLGYYLNCIEIKRPKERLICSLGIIGVLLTILLTNWISQLQQMQNELFGGYLNLNVMFESVAIFVFIKNNYAKFHIEGNLKIFVRKLSKYSFGTYMIHAMMIDIVRSIIERVVILENPFFAVSIITTIVLTVSYAISAMFNYIPILEKYIV